MEKLSILMAAYNEEACVGEIARRVLEVPLPEGLERELVIIDDGSTDSTPRICEQLARAYPTRVIFARQETNQGKGAAIRRALDLATGDVCVIQDADLEYDPADLPKLLKPILDGQADAVYGTRFVPSQYRRVLYFWHFLGNRLLTLLSNMLTNLNLTDIETGYKAIRTQLLKSIPIRRNRFGVEPELTAKLARRRCRIYEVPISYRGRTYDEGKKITWVDGVKAIFTILFFALVDDAYKDAPGHSTLALLARRANLNRWIADAIRPWVGRHVVEIGAGLATLTMKVHRGQEWIVSDVEPLHLEYLHSFFAFHPTIQVRKLDMADSADFEGLPPVDTVLCVNVLEHIRDDLAALRNARAALASDGRIVLLVPQGPWLYGALDRALGHHRRYTRDELAAKLRDAGFLIEHIGHFHKSGTLPWFVSSRILRRKTLGRYSTWLYDKLVWLWRICDGWLPLPGLSLIAVGRKET